MTAMNTLHQDAPATGGESLDLQALTRALLESALNAIMDEQADMACEGGANSRNGYRECGLVTPVGKITLRIPKLRCGTYFPEGTLERYSRAECGGGGLCAADNDEAVSARWHRWQVGQADKAQTLLTVRWCGGSGMWVVAAVH